MQGTLILLGSFKSCYCFFYACVLSVLLLRLRCIVPIMLDYAAGVYGSGKLILAAGQF